jgi:glycosyltransferase involved in cell wall biosynthesis
MNVLVIEDSSKVGFGGGQRVTEKVISLLSEEYGVFMVDFISPSKIEGRTRGSVRGFLCLKTGGRIRGVRSSYSLNLGELVALPWFFVLNMVKLLPWCREKLGRNVVTYCATKKALLYGIALKLTAGYCLVYHCHTASPPKVMLAKILNRLASLYCDRIIVVSQFVQREFGDSSKTDLIYNAAWVETGGGVEPRVLGETITVGFVGNLLPGKGFDIFAGVAERMSGKGQKYAFHAYGENPNGISIPPVVKYRGFCERETIYKEIDILLFCSTVPEACPLAPLEAQAWGIPVVGPGFGAMPEIVWNGVSGILYESAEEISGVLERLSNHETYRVFSEKSLESAGRFGEKRFRERIGGIFGDIEGAMS